MNVFVANEQEIPVDVPRSAELARHTLSSEDVGDETELSVLFVTSDHMRKLNARFANNDYATDVLAFPLMDGGDEDDDDFLLGDVVVCPQVANENAEKLGHALSHEVDTLIVHGTLHLLGYDHQGEEDKARMDKRMAEVLRTFREAQA